MYGDLGRGINTMFGAMLVGLIISIPLAIWKLVDIGIWIYNNVSVTIK
jgi:hypothetical protein